MEVTVESVQEKITGLPDGDPKKSFQARLDDIVNETPQTINDSDELDSLENLDAEVKLAATPPPPALTGEGGRRRKYSRRGRRSAKKSGGTRRKQKRRQRRGSRRAY